MPRVLSPGKEHEYQPAQNGAPPLENGTLRISSCTGRCIFAPMFPYGGISLPPRNPPWGRRGAVDVIPQPIAPTTDHGVLTDLDQVRAREPKADPPLSTILCRTPG
jgi:hypothetical protein